MNNLAYKVNENHKLIGEMEQPLILQSMMVNNNADIVKAIDYINKELADTNNKDRISFLKEVKKRYENLMFGTRLELTESLFESATPPVVDDIPFKMEEEDEKDRIIGPNQKVKETKTIQHPASKSNNKSKKGEKSKAKKLTQEEKNGDGNYKSQLEKSCDTDAKIIARFNEHLPKIEKYLEDGNRDKARQVIKIALMCYGTDIAYLTDTEIEHLLNWLKSNHFEWRSIVDFKIQPKPSIADVIKQAEQFVKIDSKTEQEVKDIIKPYFFGQIREENINVKTDEEFEEKFKNTLQYLFDKEHKVENQPKEFNRENTKKEMYDLYKKEGVKGVRKMASNFHKALEAAGLESKLNARISEILAYLKKVDTKLLDEYIAHKNANISKQQETKKEETTRSEDKQTEKSKESVVVPEGDSNPNVDIDIYKTQISAFKKIGLIKNYLVTLINKRPNDLKDIVSNEDMESLVYQIAKDCLLSNSFDLKDGKTTEDWNESDVAEWIINEVIPYTTDLYEILSSTNDEEFRVSYKRYVEKFPSPEEGKRVDQLKEVLASEVPRTDYMKRLNKKFKRKSGIQFINDQTELLYKEAQTK